MTYSKHGAFTLYEDQDDTIKRTILNKVKELNGLVDLEIQTKLMDTMLADLDTQGGVVPYNPRVATTGKWRVVSSLQKAIRREDMTAALKAAIALHNLDEKYLWRRLCIMALENVGVANLQLIALIMSIQGKKVWREDNGGIFILLYVVESLVNTVCDRTCCTTAVGSVYHPNHIEFKEKTLNGYNPMTYAKRYTSNDYGINERHQAGLALVGSISLKKNTGVDYCEAHKALFLESLDQMKTPTLINYIVRKGCSIGTEGLHIALPIVWGKFKYSKVTISTNTLPVALMIKGLPSVAYDMHTQEGKRSFTYFAKSCEEVAKWLDEHKGINSSVSLIGAAVFNVESGEVLRTHLSYKYQQEALDQAYKSEGLGFGIDMTNLLDLYEIVSGNLDLLNSARVRIIEGEK